MNGQTAVPSNGRTNHPIMVVVPSNGGFRVYPAANPNAVALVGGTAQAPTCTCVEYRSDTSEWGRCAHIDAVFRQNDNRAVPAQQYPHEAQGAPPQPAAVVNGNGEAPQTPVQLVLKRSVSPDGRIDSLSVEVHQTVELGQNGDVVQHAIDTIALEDQIVGFFLQRGRPQGNGHRYAGKGHAPAGNGYAPGSEAPVPAELTHIGGMQTKRGYSLYLNVQVNGQEARLFGPAQKLAGYISDAGYQPQNFPLVANQRLGLPCQVILDRKTNSKYPVIERVLPQASNLAGAGRGQ